MKNVGYPIAPANVYINIEEKIAKIITKAKDGDAITR